jgi:acetolactate synthase-1/2/3 large subunit
VELPEDIAEQNTEAKPMTPIRFRRSPANSEMVAVAADKIRAAKRPIILAGNGCVRTRSSENLRELVDLTGIGVLNTFMAKGAIDPNSEQSLYTIGLGSKDIGTCAIDAADIVIAIGFDMVEYHPSLWNEDGKKTIIHLDFVPAEIDSAYHPEVELVGDVADTLKALVAELKSGASFDFDLGQQQRTRQEMMSELNHYNDDETTGIIKPQKVLHEVSKVYAKDGLLLSDVGAHKMWIARHYHCETPNGCLIPNGFCSMGFALPGAIGASLVDPDRKIIGIAGDAGFLMNVQEMETASRLNSNITMMVWEDKAYGLIAWKQWAQFGEHTDLSFQNPDWELLAKSFRWDYQFVADSKDLDAALVNAAEHRGPSLIVIPIDYEENQKLTRRLGELTCTI